MLRLWLLPVISSLVASFGCASAAKRSEACVWPCLQAFLTRLHSQVSQRRTPVLVRVSARVHLHGLDTPALHLHFSETWTNLPKLAGINQWYRYCNTFSFQQNQFNTINTCSFPIVKRVRTPCETSPGRFGTTSSTGALGLAQKQRAFLELPALHSLPLALLSVSELLPNVSEVSISDADAPGHRLHPLQLYPSRTCSELNCKSSAL